MAATIMDWPFHLHLWPESKWGATPQLPGDVNHKLPRFRMINWCGCCHIQRDFYISTSACSSSAAKDSGCLEDQVLSSSSSHNPKWLLEVVWSLLLRLNVLIHRVRANLKWIAANNFQEQIVGFNMRTLSVSDMLHGLPRYSKCKFLIIVWFASFCGAFRKALSSQTVLVVKWLRAVLMPEGWEKITLKQTQGVKIVLQEMFLRRKRHTAPPCHHNHHRYTSGNPTLTYVPWK